MSNDRQKLVTRWLILVTAAVWICWDVFVWWFGVQATISEQIGKWIASSVWISVAFGLLFGHLIASMPPGTPGELNRWIGFVVGFVTAVFATRAL